MQKVKDALGIVITDLFILWVALIVVAILWLTVFPSIGSAEIVNISGTIMPDVNKTWVDDDKMCWAAVSANMAALMFDRSKANAYYKLIKDNSPNEAGTLMDGLKILTIKIKDKFSLGMLLSFPAEDTVSLRSWIKGALLKNEVVGITIVDLNSDTPMGHALTVYGYNYISKTGKRYLAYVDSDDRSKKIHVMEIEDDSHLITIVNDSSGRLTGYSIVYAISAMVMTD